MVDAAAISTLRAVLRAELEGHRSLLALLRQEQQALRTSDPDALTHLASGKLEHVTQLEDLARQRTDLLIRCGFAVTPGGLQTDALRHEAAEALRAVWAELVAVAADAQRCNALNGKLIARQRRHCDGALASLLQASGRTPVYGPDGRPEHVFAPRQLVSI